RGVPRDLGFARCCYSHLAGALGIDLADRLRRAGYVHLDGDQAALTETGRQWAIGCGFLEPRRRGRSGKPELRLCLDWTERRHHPAGPVATAMLRHLLERGHLRRGRGRMLRLTPSGEAWFAALGAPSSAVTGFCRYQSET